MNLIRSGDTREINQHYYTEKVIIPRNTLINPTFLSTVKPVLRGHFWNKQRKSGIIRQVTS